LEHELRTIETAEKRRNDVALDTEKSLLEAKYEIQQLRKEVQFVNTNRNDLELALGSLNEEKRMLERELLSIRSQLQLRAANPNTTLTLRAPLHPLSQISNTNSMPYLLK
jgi:sugar/nucleoside kinase (ribokinase family)